MYFLNKYVLQTYVLQIYILQMYVLQMYVLPLRYGVATTSRLLKIIGFFRKKAL